jgi:hypothetical protein
MQVVTWLMWLALPLTAWRFWSAWDRLPARIATHFNAAGQPNGWMTREAALEFGLGITVLFLIVFTVVSYFLQKQKVSDVGAWAVLGLFAVVVGVIFQANNSIVEYNLTGQPISIVAPFLSIPVVIVLLAVFLGAKRGTPLPDAAPIAEERHASLFFGLLLLVMALAPVIALSFAPGGARWAALPVALILVVCALFAWSGFVYRFSRGGVEVRSLGFRLRSIPIAEIQNYSIESWSLIRGYGIRGIGNSRAYVWGNKVVHIHTTQGDVYLGHDEPQRVTDDLDRMRQLVR